MVRGVIRNAGWRGKWVGEAGLGSLFHGNTLHLSGSEDRRLYIRFGGGICTEPWEYTVRRLVVAIKYKVGGTNLSISWQCYEAFGKMMAFLEVGSMCFIMGLALCLENDVLDKCLSSDKHTSQTQLRSDPGEFELSSTCFLVGQVCRICFELCFRKYRSSDDGVCGAAGIPHRKLL